MTRFCPNCGNELSVNANFCVECGTNITMLSEPEYVPDLTWADMLFKAEGRLNRLRYVKRMLSLGVIEFLLTFAAEFALMPDKNTPPPEFIYFTTIINFAGFIPGYCWDARRLHDMGKSCLLAVVGFLCNATLAVAEYFEVNILRPDFMIVAFVAFAIGLYLVFTKGMSGANEYGSDPLGRVASDNGVNWAARTISLSIGLIALIFLLALRLGLALQSL